MTDHTELCDYLYNVFQVDDDEKRKKVDEAVNMIERLALDKASHEALIEQQAARIAELEAVNAKETAWLLEKHSDEGPRYLTVRQEMFEWSAANDHLAALRLSRRVDADMLSEIIDDCYRITEHQWIDKEPKP